MRISTMQFYQSNLNNLNKLSSGVNQENVNLSAGKRVINASDDPVASNYILNYRQELMVLEQFETNIGQAESRLAVEEGSLTSGENLIIRVKELLLQANSGVYTGQERNAIAQELRSRYDEMLNIANTTDESGNYVFAGYQNSVTPFSKQPDGTVLYLGDEGQREVKIGAGVLVATSDSGERVFQKVVNPQGDFRATYTVAATSDERERVHVSSMTIVNRGTYDVTANPPPYVVNFVDSDPDAAGPLTPDGVVELQIFDSDTPANQVYPTLPATSEIYEPGKKLSFNGVELILEGAKPKGAEVGPPVIAGDSISLAAQDKVDVFKTLNEVINWLEAPVSDENTEISRSLEVGHLLDDLDQIQAHFTGIRAEIGSRMQTAESQTTFNADSKVLLNTIRGELEDLDMAEAITNFQRQIVALQAAQTAFTQTQQLTLFNLI